MLLDKNKNGFSLIEVLVALSILAVITTMGFSFLITSFSGTGKSEITKTVRQNGNYTLSVIEGMLRTAKNINGCPFPVATRIDFVAQDGVSAYFDFSSNRIASGSAVGPKYLTSNEVFVDTFAVSCSQDSGNPAVVDVSFSVRQAGTPANQRASEKFQMIFSTRVIVRNDVN